MTRFSLFILFIFLVTDLYSQNKKDYIISANNDTITCKINVPKEILGNVSFNRLYRSVTVIDDKGIKKKFKPSDLKEFHFFLNSRAYHFYSKPVGKGYNLFLEGLITDSETNLYQYLVSHKGYNNLIFTEEFYVIERAGVNYLYFSSLHMLDKVKEKLKVFYSDRPDIQSFIDGKFRTQPKIQDDLKSVLTRANKIM